MDAVLTEPTFAIEQLRELYKPDVARIEQGKARQAAFFRHERPDALPMVMGGELTAEQQKIPTANLKEQFYDKELMLAGQVRSALVRANAESDGVPSIRGNFGCGTTCSCFGLEQEVFEDKMPWMLTHLTREQIAVLSKDDIKVQGTFARGLEYMRFYKEIMGDAIPIFVMDTQGPFDLAHLIMGDDIFLAIYDDPQLVHHLMELCLELGIQTITMMKEINGEPLGQHYHSNHLYSENFGTRICEDTTAIVGPDIINEFAIPYSARLADHFGGAWVHYCGRNDELTKAICDNPSFKAMNFGHIPGHEHDQPFEVTMERCLETNTVYTGGWPRRPDESARDYIKRLQHWAAQGVLMPNLGTYADDPDLDTVEKVKSFWYSL